MPSFRDDITGVVYPYPTQRKQAITLNYLQYNAPTPCPKCGSTLRDTLRDDCMGCFRRTMIDYIWPDFIRDVNPSLNEDVAIRRGDEFYYQPLCKRGAHIRKLRVGGNGQCVECTEERKRLRRLKPAIDKRTTPSSEMARSNPEMVISRSDAVKLGINLFRTGTACARGHKGWRQVSNGACVDCRKPIPGDY